MNNFWMGVAYGMIGLWAVNICRYLREKHKRRIKEAEDRMSRCYVEKEIPFTDGKTVKVPWAECIPHVAYSDAVKVFMCYEKYRDKYLKQLKKIVREQEKALHEDE